MGKVFDKHGRMHHEETGELGTAEICPRCFKKVQDMTEHRALFHPVYRSDVEKKPEPKLVPAKDQTKLFTDNVLDEEEKGS